MDGLPHAETEIFRRRFQKHPQKRHLSLSGQIRADNKTTSCPPKCRAKYCAIYLFRFLLFFSPIHLSRLIAALTRQALPSKGPPAPERKFYPLPLIWIPAISRRI